MNHVNMIDTMRSLVQERERAITLRKKGLSYNEILEKVHVAKSSLSLWLKDFPLTSDEKHSLKDRKSANVTRGRLRASATHTKNRLLRERGYLEEAKAEFEKYKLEPMFQVGVSLYWAEGTKRSSQFSFTNSDQDMISVMIAWLERYTGCLRTALNYRLYIHKPYAHEKLEEFWMQILDVTKERFVKTVYKPTSLGIKKRPQYKGCLRIEIPKSHKLLCKMRFWQSMQVECLMKE